MQDTIGVILDYVINKPSVRRITGDYLTTLYESSNKDHTIVHVVNISRTLAKEKDVRISMYDPVPDFTIGEEAIHNKQFELSFLCNYQPKIIKLISPEWMIEGKNAEQTVEFTYDNGYVSLQIPEGTFAGYLMVDAIR